MAFFNNKKKIDYTSEISRLRRQTEELRERNAKAKELEGLRSETKRLRDEYNSQTSMGKLFSKAKTVAGNLAASAKDFKPQTFGSNDSGGQPMIFGGGNNFIDKTPTFGFGNQKILSNKKKKKVVGCTLGQPIYED